MNDFVPFALPDLGTEEIEAVVEALRSDWVSTGPRTRAFEERFAVAIGPGLYGVAVNSATAGLHLALEALGVGEGDEVLVPTWTFTATAEVVRYLGAEPVLVDVLPSTLTLDFEDAHRRCTPRTRAIMPVHYAGLAIAPSQIREFAEAHDIAVVEDAAHAFPAAAEGICVGGAGSNATVFSFYATKTITTGEGGMLVTPDIRIAERARVMRLHGMSRDAFDRYRSNVPSWKYDVIAPGFKYNMTDVAAAMGLVQLRRAREMRDRRMDVAKCYTEAFADLPIELPLDSATDGDHAWHLYTIRLPESTNRDDFIAEMYQRKIGTSVHFIPLHLQSYWRARSRLTEDDFPVASREFQRVVSLPIFSKMQTEHVERVISAVRESFGS